MKLRVNQCAVRHLAVSRGGAMALSQLSLDVGSGEHVAIIGPSGAGKTTLLHLLACALKPAQGDISLDGKDPWALSGKGLKALRRQLFLAPQMPPLPPRQRVVTSVLAGKLPSMSLFQSLRSLFYPVDIPAADEALALFDLSEKLFERVDRLSGGERQRVGLARAIVSEADLLLVDEPLSALDPTRAEQALQTLIDQARARGCTLVTTLHHVEMALKHFPRIVGLRDGCVVFDLPAQDVTRDILDELYAQHPEELEGTAPVEDLPQPTAKPAVVMHCR